MKFRYFTDAHLDNDRTESRPFRCSELAEGLIGDLVDTSPDDLDFLVFGGDAIQMNRPKGQDHHEDMIKTFYAAVSKTKAAFEMVAGNHDYDYFGSLEKLSELMGIGLESKFIDTPDGHRLIFINDTEPFHDRQLNHIKPFAQETLDFIEAAVNGAPTKSVTLFSHTPIDHTDWYETKMLMHDGDPEYSFRPNSDEVRDVLEGSGKNCLVVSGHTHYETISRDRNVVYMTVQSLVEAVRTDPAQVFERWADFEREGDDIIRVKTYGYDAREFEWQFDDNAVHNPPVALLAAE